MIVNHIEVRLATISFEERIIRYLAEFHCLPNSNGEEISCFFCVPTSSNLALIVRCKDLERLKKNYCLTLQSSHAGEITKEFILSESDLEFGHIMAVNANKTGLPSTDLDVKWLSDFGEKGKNSMKLTVRAGKDGLALAIFNLSIKKTANQEAIHFSADSPLRFAPHNGSFKNSTSHQHKLSRERNNDEDDGEGTLSDQTPKKMKHVEDKARNLHLSNLIADTAAKTSSQVQTSALNTVVKAEPEEINNAETSKRSIDRSTQLELIMQQEQREKIHSIENEIEAIIDEYEKEKGKIHSKIRKLEKNRKEKKEEFKQTLHSLRKAKVEAQEKLDWIISNTAPIEIDTSEGEQSITDGEQERTMQIELPLVISDSDDGGSDTSEDENEIAGESHRSKSSKMELDLPSQKSQNIYKKGSNC